MPEIELRAAAVVDGRIDLGVIDIGMDDSDPLPVQLVLTNGAANALSEIRVGLKGDGASSIRLAADTDGEPGVWAAAGEEIIAHAGTLAPKKECSFWAQAVATEGLDLGRRDFNFVVKTTQV